MRYLAKRVERICDELYRLRIVQRIPLTDLICKKGTYIRPEAADAATPPWTSFDSRTMHWYGPDEHICSARNSPCRKRLTARQCG